ncbi:LytTR family DNA-binding domain-containing protein [Lactobacillus delbrueckii]|uniref:LytTR family DNA-binding domain-containing protein n=1 Tax=Lactobacillus delbrueckii TaxID=1584 RepID=UPI001BFF723D|nr:LytTR family DNA-binding domain-containing protein [Lactobacillus delbrueckii]MBT9024217.1 LytTR family transcriptional regulator [Lactobacillus delbrueckii subsp. bulgaricus]MCD5460762.1 LytTR family transcriptional regulator [Lactobacillus delbrueckii subsp. bulgaricus]MCT3482120.1 LytTR family transcriptional regulator [Lactobacillus delbrueckii subsp. bulgaricus]MCT3495756.1 LytTR family transcriptional regulator [Lactobacillus delbrueckii subsp. bulgaricus]MCT3497378.1 LytTR family tra
MQVEFKQDKQLKEDQLIIKAKKLTPEIEAALAFLEEKMAQKITVYQGSDVIILPLTSILFFETSDRHVWAHDREGSYLVKQTLRQLEAILPSDFDRASKSALVNCRQINAVKRSIMGCELGFTASYKKVFVSRRYYQTLISNLHEMR